MKSQITKSSFVWAGIVMLLAVFVFVKLGFWQLERQHWKEGLIASIAAEKQVDAASVPLSAFVWDKASGFKRGYLTGVWMDDKNVKVGPQMGEEGLGYWVVSPLVLNDGSVVLVNRGWVPESMIVVTLEGGMPKGVVTLTGALRAADGNASMVGGDPKSWHGLDVEQIAGALGLDNVAPLALFVETSTPPDDALFKPAAALTNLRNEHFHYALFWFGMAVLTVGLFAFASLPKKR